MTFSHDLSLKCSMFRHQKGVAESKVIDLQKDASDAKQKEKDALDAKASLETPVVENDAKIADLEGLFFREVASRAEDVIEGREAYLRSDEYKKVVAAHRLEGARDFLKAPAFKLVVDIQSAHFLNEGLDKCVSQVDHIKGFVDGFDRTRLDPSLYATRQPYPDEAAPATLEADEFEALAAEVTCVP
ncbi:hypothetical protein Salat_0696700 [Sesamum alatum]|uniref:Uncharacterized protein n=1 Tax=Sesamum alatum TaxID=300844 RepID=A0AAE2CUV5_9LAMI|nr:hypothetical protein Salat_0696700 [Sesamum alatum]